MMRYISLTCLLCLNLLLAAQVCDTIIDGKPMNCTDKYGNKQGTWVTFENKSRHCFDSEGISSISSVGNYEDGEKVDTWRYFNGPKVNSGMSREVIYHKDGSLEEKRANHFGSLETIMSKDSVIVYKRVNCLDYNYVMEYQGEDRVVVGNGSVVVGKGSVIVNKESGYEFKVRNEEVVAVNCFNDSCSFILENGVVLLNFYCQNLMKLEFELDRLSLGIYNTKIRAKKTSAE